ncbi:hypothetical protein KQI84_11940 [bacterium]|nr:hypothetical protein [bacterium]
MWKKPDKILAVVAAVVLLTVVGLVWIQLTSLARQNREASERASAITLAGGPEAVQGIKPAATPTQSPPLTPTPTPEPTPSPTPALGSVAGRVNFTTYPDAQRAVLQRWQDHAWQTVREQSAEGFRFPGLDEDIYQLLVRTDSGFVARREFRLSQSQDLIVEMGGDKLPEVGGEITFGDAPLQNGIVYLVEINEPELVARRMKSSPSGSILFANVEPSIYELVVAGRSDVPTTDALACLPDRLVLDVRDDVIQEFHFEEAAGFGICFTAEPTDAWFRLSLQDDPISQDYYRLLAPEGDCLTVSPLTYGTYMLELQEATMSPAWKRTIATDIEISGTTDYNWEGRVALDGGGTLSISIVNPPDVPFELAVVEAAADANAPRPSQIIATQKLAASTSHVDLKNLPSGEVLVLVRTDRLVAEPETTWVIDGETIAAQVRCAEQ